jgi:hypothetical protein
MISIIILIALSPPPNYKLNSLHMSAALIVIGASATMADSCGESEILWLRPYSGRHYCLKTCQEDSGGNEEMQEGMRRLDCH